MNSGIMPWLGATSPPWFKALFLILVALAIPGFFVVMWIMSRSQIKKKKLLEPKLNRAEALRNLESFTRELEAGWKRDGLDWAPELLGILAQFNREASKSAPDWTQLEQMRNEMRAFIASRKFLKGISFVLEYADAACRPESEL